jgi:hypothetical protein
MYLRFGQFNFFLRGGIVAPLHCNFCHPLQCPNCGHLNHPSLSLTLETDTWDIRISFPSPPWFLINLHFNLFAFQKKRHKKLYLQRWLKN